MIIYECRLLNNFVSENGFCSALADSSWLNLQDLITRSIEVVHSYSLSVLNRVHTAVVEHFSICEPAITIIVFRFANNKRSRLGSSCEASLTNDYQSDMDSLLEAKRTESVKIRGTDLKFSCFIRANDIAFRSD